MNNLPDNYLEEQDCLDDARDLAYEMFDVPADKEPTLDQLTAAMKELTELVESKVYE